MRNSWLIIGLLTLGVAGCATMPWNAKEKKEGKEEKVAFAQLPAAVQKTLNDEGKGNKIETADKESEDGKTVYEADVKIEGTNYEIKVAEDGSLISKKLDQEEDKDKDEKKEGTK